MSVDFVPEPETLIDLDAHLRSMHGMIVYSQGDYEQEHAEQHQRMARGTLGDHAEFVKPHKHTATEDEYRWAWSTAYWAARDDGYSRTDALDHADAATERYLDALEEAP